MRKLTCSLLVAASVVAVGCCLIAAEPILEIKKKSNDEGAKLVVKQKPDKELDGVWPDHYEHGRVVDVNFVPGSDVHDVVKVEVGNKTKNIITVVVFSKKEKFVKGDMVQVERFRWYTEEGFKYYTLISKY